MQVLSPLVLLGIVVAVVVVAAVASTPHWRRKFREHFAASEPGTMDQLMSTRAPSARGRFVEGAPSWWW
jgi:hypothetical protein